MKYFYTFIFTLINLVLLAQTTNPQDLLNKDWRLQKIVKSGVEMLPPPPVEILNSNLSYISSIDKYSFNPRYYNSGNCSVTFTAGENSFTYEYSQFPFIYSGENAEAVNNYDKTMLDFYLDYRSQKYFYEYIVDQDIYNLIITNPVGDKMYFRSTVALSTADVKSVSYQFYPNPARDVLKISSQEKVESIHITDASGKIILQRKLNDLNPVVDVKNLSSGIYYIKINKHKAQKFIKQ